MNRTRYNNAYLWLVCSIAALGGLLFGYDFVVIGGAKPFYEAYWGISNNPWLQGWAMSSALVGCLLGVFISGSMADLYGRKKLLILAAVFFSISAIGTAVAGSLSEFVFFRILGGGGIGLASGLSPLFIAEISPREYRGRFVSFNQLTIVIGILIAQIVNYIIAQPVPEGFTPTEIATSWNGQGGWRCMFIAEIIPAAMFLVLMLFMPESPRWLVKKGDRKAAEYILARVGGHHYAASELVDIERSLNVDEIGKVHFSELWDKRMLPVLALGVFLAVFQQWCGINVIFNYAEEIFTSAGYHINGMMFNIVITGIINLLFTFIAIACVDRWGRRPLMLIGASGLALIYATLGYAYYIHLTGPIMLFLVLAAIACFAMTLGPMVWVIIAEMFPNRIRGAAVSVAVASLWIACTILTYTFPILKSVLGAHGTFWIYAGICFVSWFVLLRCLPETRGKSLEEVEKIFFG